MVYAVSERPAVGLSGPMADTEVLSSEDTAKSRLALYSCILNFVFRILSALFAMPLSQRQIVTVKFIL